MPFSLFAPYRKRQRGPLAAGIAPPVAAPDTPSEPTPSNGGNAYYSLLSWTSARATQFDIYFGTSATPPLAIPKYVGTSHVPGSTVYIPALQPSTTYYWQIVAFNGGGRAAGPIWSFTTFAASQVLFLVNGSVMNSRIRFPQGLQIHDVLGAAPNTATALFDTVAPTAGQSITIGLGTLDPGNLLFGGEIQSVDQSYESKPGLMIWPANLIDHTFAINKRRPFGTFVNQSATAIARTIIAQYAPGFTSTYVQADLPTISINFDGQDDFMSCMSHLAQSIDGRTKVDYSRNVHLFIPPETGITAPSPIDETHPPLNDPAIKFSTDLSQCRTTLYGKGHGESVDTDVNAREPIIPLPNAVMFNALGGQAIAGTTSDGAQTQIFS